MGAGREVPPLFYGEYAMSLRKAFKTDRALEIDGVTLPVGINDHNKKAITITISRMSPTNKRYSKALEEATRPHETSLQTGTMDNELGRQVLQQVFAETILIGWDNLPKSDLTGDDADDGEFLEFTPANAIALFEELPDLYNDWEGKAQKASTFRAKERDKNAGNSQGSSHTSSISPRKSKQD